MRRRKSEKRKKGADTFEKEDVWGEHRLRGEGRKTNGELRDGEMREMGEESSDDGAEVR